jgi:gliding motility-associated-like protein
LQNTFAPPYLLTLHLLASDLSGQNNDHNKFDSQWITLDSTRIPIEFVAGDLYAGLYQLSITDKFGCKRIDSLSISVDTKIFIPNIFTPNNDGFNDNFEIVNLPAKSSIMITNRWGKEVYKGSLTPSSSVIDPNNPGVTKTLVWNGGSESDGVYYYTLNTPGKTYTGWIELQR